MCNKLQQLPVGVELIIWALVLGLDGSTGCYESGRDLGHRLVDYFLLKIKRTMTGSTAICAWHRSIVRSRLSAFSTIFLLLNSLRETDVIKNDHKCKDISCVSMFGIFARSHITFPVVYSFLSVY